ncbi:MAG TPA: hypothetical protein ENI96_04420 [Sedimenticola thiotaurini]|uniref:Uncharacterized protein n=1 Tax=Sedimenticola thiotaurini TaxID=1543721 RepID=A0A831W2J9_9GAMM|nr:hypothetical protein [Sedimenticola thiotaurini]
MDQDAYHRTYREINDRYCLYEKAILAGKCSCSQASRFYLAERVGVHCGSDEGQARCETFLQLLRHHTRFTLKLTADSGALPHAKALRLQAGGINGLHLALYPERELPQPVADVYRLLLLAQRQYRELERLPYPEIIKQVAAFRGRERRSRR